VCVQDFSKVTIHMCQFIANQASKVGGGLYTQTRSEVDLRIGGNSLFQGNTLARPDQGKAMVSVAVLCLVLAVYMAPHTA